VTSSFGISLKILVFGPNPSATASSGYLGDLLRKRNEIRDALQSDGHTAVFPEDLGSIPDPALNGNAWLWERQLVLDYDMVVNLVASPGTIAELPLFEHTPITAKAAFFFDEAQQGGLTFQYAQTLEARGATLHTYKYPDDLTMCCLLKHIRQMVWKIRVAKFLVP